MIYLQRMCVMLPFDEKDKLVVELVASQPLATVPFTCEIMSC